MNLSAQATTESAGLWKVCVLDVLRELGSTSLTKKPVSFENNGEVLFHRGVEAVKSRPGSFVHQKPQHVLQGCDANGLTLIDSVELDHRNPR